MNNKLCSEIFRLARAFGYSFHGLKVAFRQPAFRLEIIIGAIMIAVSLLLNKTATEHALLIGSIFLVWIVELLNTGIETAIDRISLERHPLSKQAKDVASAAVLVAIIHACVLWFLIMFC